MLARGVNWLFIATMPFFINSSNYGLVILLISIELILSNVLVLGQDKYTLRYSFKLRGIYNKSVKLLTITSLLSFLFIPALLFYFPHNISWGEGVFFFLSISLNIFFRVYYSQCRVDADVNGYTIVKMINVLMKVAFFYLLLYKTEDVTFSYVISTFISQLLLIYLVVIKFKKRYITNAPVESSVFLFGLPISFHLLSTSLISHADKFIINGYLGVDKVGLYTFSYMLGSGFTFVLSALAIYFEPIIYKFSEDYIEREKIISKFALYSFFAFLMYVLIILLFVLLSTKGVFNVETLPKVIFLSCLSHYLNATYLGASFRLYSKGKSFSVASVTVICAFLNVIGNFMLIPIFGLLGAISATLISSTLLSVIMVFTSLNNTKEAVSKIRPIFFAWLVSLLILVY